ncbi:MAG: hypothetical protein ABI605_07230 [Rhizobacter sp.]
MKISNRSPSWVRRLVALSFALLGLSQESYASTFPLPPEFFERLLMMEPLMAMQSKMSCDVRFPELKQKTDPFYVRWQEKKRVAIEAAGSMIQKNTPGRNWRATLQQEAREHASEVEASQCSVDFWAQLAAGSADSFESPQATWKTFQSALKTADQALALACLDSEKLMGTLTALAQSGQTIRRVSVETETGRRVAEVVDGAGKTWFIEFYNFQPFPSAGPAEWRIVSVR